MTTYVYRDGSRLTPYMLYQINRLDADFYKEFGEHILVTSGIRTAEEQERIFRMRYTLTPNGRKVYDTRWWRGQLWYRIDPTGTVAQPRTSNHEIQGTKAAVDLRDTGKDAGVRTGYNRRANWLRQNAWRYGMVPSGYGFGEPWHYDFLNIFKAVPGSTSGSKEKKTVILYHTEDYTCRHGGRKLPKGAAFWLNETKGAPSNRASSLVGGIGNYTFAVHVYATGTPGDVLDVKLYWGRGRAESGHYNEQLTFNEDGVIQANIPFIRPVAKGYSVYANLIANKANKGTSTVTLFDADALLIV